MFQLAKATLSIKRDGRGLDTYIARNLKNYYQLTSRKICGLLQGRKVLVEVLATRKEDTSKLLPLSWLLSLLYRRRMRKLRRLKGGGCFLRSFWRSRISIAAKIPSRRSRSRGSGRFLYPLSDWSACKRDSHGLGFQTFTLFMPKNIAREASPRFRIKKVSQERISRFRQNCFPRGNPTLDVVTDARKTNRNTK